MRAKINGKSNSAWVTAALCLALAVLGLLHFGGTGTKWMTLLAGFGVIALLLLGDRRRIWNAPSLLLLGYAAFSWVTIFWAMSGKFHLREGSKILIAVFFFLLVAVHKKFDRAFVRRVMSVISGISAVYAILNVAAAAYEPVYTCLSMVLRAGTARSEFNGGRLYGISGNSNIEASICAIGVLFSVALVCSAKKKSMRALFACALTLSAFSFVLAISLVATCCFIAAVVAYLFFAGKGRTVALVHMLLAAVPTLICAVWAFQMIGNGRVGAVLPVMLANAAVCAGLELLPIEKFSALLEAHQRLTNGVLLGTAVCSAIFAIAVLTLTDTSYRFGEELFRGISLDAGVHTMQVDADGAILLRIRSSDKGQVAMGETTELYTGDTEEMVEFTVPEGSVSVILDFTAQPGVAIRKVVMDGTQTLALRNKLLPVSISNRLQNTDNNHSVIQRRVYREDAIKLWKLSPIVGDGVGAFETGVTSVQDYPYETKYVHQHYLQVLLEDGVIGLTLYVSALLTMVVALWRKRKQTEESEFYWLYPALCAEFVMNGGQMFWDVSMSMIVFVCMTYALYGLIVGICAEPIMEKVASTDRAKKKEKPQVKKVDTSLLIRNVGVGFTVVVVLTLCGNLYADSRSNAPVGSSDEFMSNLSTAARLDLYEHNDKKLSYVIASLNEGSEAYRTQADEYAAQLARAQSNTIPRYLVGYYLQTQQYDKAIDEAIFGASYSASNSDTWNSCAALLSEVFFKNMLTPLLTGEREALMAKLTDYYDALQAHNSSALVPVELSEEAQAFFDKIAVLNGCMDDDRRFVETLFTT